MGHNTKSIEVITLTVEIIGGPISEAEKQAYIKHVHEKTGGAAIHDLQIKIDGNYCDLVWHYTSQPFDRVRRVTGYLSRINKMNNGKQAEVEDRLPHEFDDYYTHNSSGLLEER